KSDSACPPIPSGIPAILLGSRRERLALEREACFDHGFIWVDRVQPASALVKKVGALRIDHLFAQARVAADKLSHLWSEYEWFGKYLERSLSPPPNLPLHSVVEGGLHV